jgi:excisionase family DNA binding protein
MPRFARNSRGGIKQPTNIEPALLDVNDAANYLATGRDQIYELVKAGELAAIKNGRRFRIVRASMDAWVRRQQTAQAREAAQ